MLPGDDLLRRHGLGPGADGLNFGDHGLELALFRDSRESRDRVVAAANDHLFAGFDLSDEFGEAGLRFVDRDGDGIGLARG
jgi:hypothetical protein